MRFKPWLMMCLLSPVVSQAQTLYRCGATYQDRPCGGVESRVVGRAAPVVDQSAGTLAVDPSCQSRGVAAQKLMWEKESGRTLDEQLLKTRLDPDFVRGVYARRGSSVDVRKAVETECANELERAQAAGGTLRPIEASRQTGERQAEASARAGSAELTGRGGAKSESGERCSVLNSELKTLQDAQRAGGSAWRMDDLAARVREAQARKSNAGC